MHQAKVLFPTGHRLFRFCGFLFWFCLPLTLVIYGGQFINLSTVAIIFAAMPVAILLVSIVILNAPTSLLQLAGASLALMSLLFFLQETFRDATSDSWKGALAVVVAVIMFACLYVQRKKRGSESQLNLN
ncbi:EamA family transporter [Buttiauxella agrestis]|uniref:EamA family transporter n=1 Tax=Buttiauxella agrestis TaxID=82977 RepID=UPI003976A632